ncbi:MULTISPECIES: ABC transporter ATP-binding protein [unclassified Clostridioides]|uniref:ABC transporter ATP-binding protein n=1 Tax=unclassified Clostridioides TaxID=2635829 RepID=UPI001D0CC1C9|nr:ABC transporter ATP-binding protein [Clostridioides sp. ES-S-0001-02]MCC0639508.1 ABC transporter ATP-binding protein [Clostridioides sp. ES-S-0049-03]MCC0655769.1 ABC transporter ATP-binding protein [Clostridioides sp. ES-S-0123-01]MCC0676566.1 ABC transporter ATP-binding protein [Clostridioides sp. ES-W-0018-02]MCC0680557.1 ABC transporter ATP-binding protein [Clostridioides sp. ES-S-0005-03]MCC0706215.1 ABC transporter ATP-binding protein [Clostridioides sp. ES-S-0190-01]MCC0711233.1 AB
MKLILNYLKNYKLLIALNILAIFSFALVELGIPTIIAKIIDNGIANQNTTYIKQMGIVIVVISIIGVVGSVLLGYCSAKISTGVTRDIRNDIFKKSQEFSHTEYNKFGISSMITRTTNDAFQIQQFVNILLRTALLTPVMFIISIIMTIRTSVELSLVLAISVPFIIIGVAVIAKISQSISSKQQKGLDKLNLISRENLTGIRVIRAFGNDDYETKRFEETNTYYANVSKKLFKLMSITQPAFFLLLNIAVLAVFWISSEKINIGEIQVGQLVAFLEYLFHAMFSIMLFSMVFIMYPRAEVSANRIKEILEEEPLIKNPKNGVKDTENKGLIEFDNVTFTYPDGEASVLKDISFTAKTGETVAFIGSTGSGKSTLINLIPRFYDVTEGSIKINGVDIREYDLKALRKKIGFIPQKALLFTGSIANNIRFGKNKAGTSELEHSAKVAQAYEFISKKPRKFDELISEGGANVSGGQKQRLSIARAIIRKPEIYIFDDSFSALDFKTDAILRSKLKKETKDAIVLIVAQRISSIIDADKIVVLNEGQVVGMGTHKELLKNCEIYYEIATSQLKKEELE